MSIGELLAGHTGLRISEPRQITLELHTHLRELILAGVFPVGTVLKQAELARFFAVSRTPMREAFRMLQEEGLLFSEPNQRSRVVGLAGDELELLYAARITLESLGVRLTAGRLSREENQAAIGALHEMDNRRRSGDVAGWTVAHRHFHRQMVSRCGLTVLRTISSYTAQTERYCHTEDFAERHREDIEILQAVRTGDTETAVRLTAEHLADIALHATHGKAITAAVQMVTDTAKSR